MKKNIMCINPPVIYINDLQLQWYNAAHPTCLLKLIRYALNQGHTVQYIDCMDYDIGTSKPRLPYKVLKAGANNLDLGYQAYIFGRSFKWLDEQLEMAESPDEIWVTCNITFNNEMAHQCIRVAKARFPEARIILGGDYATLFPEDAARSGAEIWSGPVADARGLMPDYSLFTQKLNYAVFQLTLGCRQRCEHCLNHRLHADVFKMDHQTVVDFIRECSQRYGIQGFVNMDPNIFPDDLEHFLRLIVKSRLDIHLFFYGGIEADYVTESLALLMKEAQVTGFTMPRELDDSMNRRLKKDYSPAAFYRAIDVFEKVRYNLSQCHCTIPVCFEGESLEPVVASVDEIRKVGAHVEVVPVSFVPGTPEYERHGRKIHGKTLEELNWALWPTINSLEQIRRYSDVYQYAFGHQLHPHWAIKQE